MQDTPTSSIHQSRSAPGPAASDSHNAMAEMHARGATNLTMGGDRPVAQRPIGGWVAGIVYAVSVVVGLVLLVFEEVDGKSIEEIRSYYGDSGNRTTEFLGATMILVGVLAFFWFLSALRTRLRTAGTGSSVLVDLANGAGITAAGLLLGAAALLSATSVSVEWSTDFVVDANLARFAVVMGYVFLIASVLCCCALIAATSVLAVRTTAFPTWVGWAGGATIVLAIVEALLLPVFVIPLWVLVVSIVSILRPPTVPA